MIEEKIILGKGGQYPLNGVLLLPEDTEGPVPAVVFVHGSGSTNMDEQVFQNKPFKDMAECLAALGLASIRYDKRSHVYGRKMVKDKVITVFDETIDDAIKAANMLREDQRIDPGKIYVAGHSMGGMLAPRIDAEGGDFAGLIIMAGTTRNLEDVLYEQLDTMIATQKGLVRFINRKVKESISKKLTGIYEMDDEKAKSIKTMGGTTAYYFKDMGEKNSPEYLKETEKPILIMQGGKDVQVRADLDFELYKELLEGRDNVTFKLYPDLNHLFMKSVYGTLKDIKKEYKIKGTVDQTVIDDMAGWIKTV